MKVTGSTILFTSALAATGTAALSTSSTYQLRVSSSANTAINGGFIAVKDTGVTTSPNPMGLWLTDRKARDPYQFKLATSPSDSRLYQILGTLKQTHLVLYGDKVAMGLFDIPIGSKVEVKDGEATFDDKFTTLGQQGATTLRHGQDFNSSGTDIPTGGAGSWRACKGDTVNDYQLYWYDGSSPLPIKNCEGISLDLVESTPSPASSGGPFLTGVTSPTATGSFLTGVTAPTATGRANSSGIVSPTPSSPAQGGAGSHVSEITGLMSIVFGVLAFAF
ncbi:uncharacterized protein BDR25DRAFT_338455 [Lindgomyces ingoldianus]|uniref:Uncharacterized protein n=1 Tax=Lindgomyces ingoldianus TaxID=673940 RepID=A0ACB6REI9_9PLEO|nr:uncharacterized protein BDR25DRAFT_338455 [Lindgomyces ingoldianus]KAF2477659.1 hypothetical protein BDR25DRAFT_338455 [Lindgomyces ingoldianus]